MRKIGNNTWVRRVDEGVVVQIGASRYQCPVFELVSTETAAVVEAAGFLDEMADKLPVGACINARLDLDGVAARKDYIVTANTGSAVTIAAAAS